jgi:hypothetical protein
LPEPQNSPQNPELLRAMDDLARGDTPQTREALYKTILASTLIVGGELSGDNQVSFRTIEHPPGNVILPAFTDLEALSSWASEGTPWLGLRAQALFQSIAPGNIASVLINPFRPDQEISRPGGIITRQEFLALAQGIVPGAQVFDNTQEMKVAANQQIVIGAPVKEPSPELLGKLTEHFRQISDLRSAYLFQLTNNGVSSTVVGLHFESDAASARMQEIMNGVAPIVRGAIPADVSLDFMPLKPGALLQAVQKRAKPLFQK